MRPALTSALASAIARVLLLSACAEGPRIPEARLSLEETLGGADTAGFARALEPRDFVFPADHGPHPDFRNEWWYVTGNLEAERGREVGYQLTLFRTSLAPPGRVGRATAHAEATSAWSTDQAYMGHLAVTDARGRRFRAFERFARGALGLAGAEAEPLRVWVEGWSLEGSGSAASAGGTRPADVFPLRLRAADGDVALDLVLESGKPRVLQGERGLSRKGPEPGNASYYYSHTRMPTSGTVVLGADTLRATGLSWLDREWSTSALSDGVVGWDWFALQLDDGWDLMVYALRRADGSAHPLSEGVLVDPSGTKRALEWDADVTVKPTGRWTSPVDGAAYPSGWRIAVPGAGLDLEVTPVLEDQELDLAFRYWEGAVRVSGTAAGRTLAGRGYVELTGYAGRTPER
ncbi:MAG TPA: lipocalin-like domain-containing protein [Longimicrobiales bacterium]|nr:lipocalin-like domain-containing protein [Longimicrobiales bacterium]